MLVAPFASRGTKRIRRSLVLLIVPSCFRLDESDDPIRSEDRLDASDSAPIYLPRGYAYGILLSSLSDLRRTRRGSWTCVSTEYLAIAIVE